jgi:hypothetical protein
MRPAAPLRAFALGFALLAPVGQAAADVCRSIQAELAAIGRGPSGQDRQAAQRASTEAHRLHAHMRAIGCDRQAFLFFGQPPPPECGGYRARIAQLNQVVVSSAAYQSGARRQQLMSMLVSHNCRASPDPARRSKPLVAGLFDDDERNDRRLSSDIDRPQIVSRIRSIGGKPVCVRLCDGYHFPLHLRGPNLEEDGDNACRALCPAVETRMFRMTSDIDGARDVDGKPYTALPNAYRYRVSYDPTCTCRPAGETAARGALRVLNPDEPGPGGFSEVNPEERPEAPDPAAGLRGPDQTGRPEPATVFGRNEPPPPPHEPMQASADRMVSADEGETREMNGANGVRRTVRIIAPELFRAP